MAVKTDDLDETTTDEAEESARSEADGAFDEAFGLSEDDVEEDIFGANDEDGEDGDDDELDTGGESLDDEAGDEAEAAEGEGDATEAAADAAPARDDKGRFAKPGDAPAAGAAGTPAPAAVTKPTAPEPFTVRVDKAIHAIDEAKVVKANGHHFFVVPDGDVAKFTRRVQMGIQAAGMWRQLQQGMAELEIARKAPSPKSDSEIEAEITLQMIEQHLPEIMDERDLEILKLRVANGITAHQKEFADRSAQFRAEQLKPQQEEDAGKQREQEELEGLASCVLKTIEATPALHGLSQDQIKAVYHDLNSIRRAVIWRDGENKWQVNWQQILSRLQHAASSSTGKTTAPPPSGPTAGDPATSSTQSKKARDAERFNAGVTGSKPPSTTSVKANRGTTSTSRPRSERPTRDDATPARTKKAKTRDMAAEDDYRAKVRKWERSPDLEADFDDED